MQNIHDAVHFFVVDEGEDGIIECWPSVGAIMSFTRFRATSCYFVPTSESANSLFFKEFGDFFVICLIIGYEYCCNILASFLS